jgi:hypothetical protein
MCFEFDGQPRARGWTGFSGFARRIALGLDIGDLEVFEVDAGELKSLVGAHRCFYIDETSGAFWARLSSLEPCVSTHHGLALLRDKPTLQGVLIVVEEPATRQ